MVSADKNGLSDPYVKAKIIPEAEDGEAKYKTKTCRKNLNPDAKDELKKATRVAVQKHRENWNEEKRIEIQEKDLKYKQNKR